MDVRASSIVANIKIPLSLLQIW